MISSSNLTPSDRPDRKMSGPISTHITSCTYTIYNNIFNLVSNTNNNNYYNMINVISAYMI